MLRLLKRYQMRLTVWRLCTQRLIRSLHQSWMNMPLKSDLNVLFDADGKYIGNLIQCYVINDELVIQDMSPMQPRFIHSLWQVALIPSAGWLLLPTRYKPFNGAPTITYTGTNIGQLRKLRLKCFLVIPADSLRGIFLPIFRWQVCQISSFFLLLFYKVYHLIYLNDPLIYCHYELELQH